MAAICRRLHRGNEHPHLSTSSPSNMASSDATAALADCQDREKLTQLLSTLLEPSAALRDLLVPSVLERLSATSAPPASYGTLVDMCADAAKQWTYEQKADFVSGHPMIGEVKNLSAHSAKEQSSQPTRPIVLER